MEGGPLQLLGHLDDRDDLQGSSVDGVPVLGRLCDWVDYVGVHFVLCLARPSLPDIRAQVVDRLELPPSRWTTVVADSAVVSATSTVGEGSVLLAGVVLTAAVHVGRHVVVMPQTVLTHDDVVEDYVTLASGVRIGGSARLGRACYIGAGAIVREGARVGAGSMLGMGAVLTRDMPEGQTWTGVPARPHQGHDL